MTKSKKPGKKKPKAVIGYDAMFSGVAGLLAEARRNSVRAVNAIITATYWEVGRRIIEYEQGGMDKAVYGEKVIVRLSNDLTERFGRGFSKRNVEQMRLFYLTWPIAQMSSAQSGISRILSGKTGIDLSALAACFPLPWSHYVRLLHIEAFLLELGSDFTFVGRQRRLRIGDSWYRIDLLFYHRRLRCLVVIDLKLGKFTHADAGQMHTYLNYVRDHWMLQDENPPVGLILCAEKDHVFARYALEGLPNKVLAAEYKMALPNEKALVAEIDKTRKALESRRRGGADGR